MQTTQTTTLQPTTVTHGMELSQLQKHIRMLVTIAEDERAPIVSCYARRDLEPKGPQAPVFDRQVMDIRRVLRGDELAHFEEAHARIESYLLAEVLPASRGVATFSRGGARPFFVGLQFQVPLPNRLSVGTTPDIFHLVELKDTYHRYVVLIVTEASARILEVNLGAITRELWFERPELRERVGREWARERYQNHRRDRGDRFLKEKISTVEKLMAAGGLTHLILAGSPQLTARLRHNLPKHLQAKLLDIVPAAASARIEDVVAATLSTFIDHEQQESLGAVDRLVSSLKRGGLGVAGTHASAEVLRRGQADVLVMAREYAPGPAWACKPCGAAAETSALVDRCSECGSTELRTVNFKEALISLAERQSVEVEIVQHSDVLMDLGGVGCLLRYATDEDGR